MGFFGSFFSKIGGILEKAFDSFQESGDEARPRGKPDPTVATSNGWYKSLCCR
ncbi:hypothetical protein BOTBODRAFT_27469 [Botryobasidium botryosum FD-172 SS1]|uniref:Uncharacterized protein n=1 Tax=Botryobasidium botryosum (strain FD-172 SS1) TaxID=930990 RepID=A0A067MZB1_BOTB1|nr:hypothetical protein BOTBODRAFT_27469 [Botryobasidium botryosum FD-172 SS1]